LPAPSTPHRDAAFALARRPARRYLCAPYSITITDHIFHCNEYTVSHAHLVEIPVLKLLINL
jgi:hypothetical protein